MPNTVLSKEVISGQAAGSPDLLIHSALSLFRSHSPSPAVTAATCSTQVGERVSLVDEEKRHPPSGVRGPRAHT